MLEVALKKYLFITYILFITMSVSANAQVFNIYCSDKKGKHWEWLPSTNSKYVQIHAKLKRRFLNRSRYYKPSVLIRFRLYQQLKNECINYYPHLVYPKPSAIDRDNSSLWIALDHYSINGKPIIYDPSYTDVRFNAHRWSINWPN